LTTNNKEKIESEIMGSIRRRRRSSASSDETLAIKPTLDQKPRIAFAKRKKPDKPIVVGFQASLFVRIHKKNNSYIE
jgi:hypothetical protein